MSRYLLTNKTHLDPLLIILWYELKEISTFLKLYLAVVLILIIGIAALLRT